MIIDFGAMQILYVAELSEVDWIIVQVCKWNETRSSMWLSNPRNRFSTSRSIIPITIRDFN